MKAQKSGVNTRANSHSNVQGGGMGQDVFARKPLAVAIAGVMLGSAGQAWAIPSVPVVEAGAATVATTSTTMDINQSSNKLILNFDEFGIQANEAVRFNQPGADSVALSRVVGGNPSIILGQLTANGQIFLLNSQGVVFGEGSQVDVGGLVAGTLNMETSDFLAGTYVFKADGATGSVLNAGDISAAEGGYVVLLGAEVTNEGVVTAAMGNVALLSGDAVTLDFDGDGLLSYAIDESALSALVENRGVIRADGGLVVMAASTAGQLTTSVVNNGGVLAASGMVERDGRIILTSNATTANTGAIDVSSASATGGSVLLEGARAGQFGHVNADGRTGGGEVHIGATDVIDIGGGSVTSANATGSGDGGSVVAFTEGDALFRSGARIEAQGGPTGGDGGFIEVSGKDNVEVRGLADTSAISGEVGTFLIDPTDIDILAVPTSGLGNTGNNFQSDGSTGSSFLAVADLEANLALGNVVVTTQTGAELLTAPKGGDITVLAAVTSASGNNLTLQAGEDIQVFANVDIGTGTLDLQAGVRTDINSGSILATGVVTAAAVTSSADTSIIMVNLSTDSVTAVVNQTGPITLTNNKTFTVSADTATSGGTGDISVTTTAGNINVGLIDAGSETVTLNAAAAIDAAADNATAELRGATLNLTAATGIGAGGTSLDIENVTTVSATTADGNIDIDAIGGAGTLTFSSVVNNGAVTDNIVIDQSGGQAIAVSSATTIDGDITITSDADVSFGSITAGSAGDTVTITTTGAIAELGADVAVDLVASNAALSGTTGIGASGTIETDLDTLAATGADIDLSNTGALDLTTVGTLSNVTSTGNVSIANDLGITLTDDISATGTVTLAATAGDIITAAEDAGAEIAGTTVTLNALAGNVGDAGVGGAIDVTASAAVNADVSTANGNIYIDAVDDIPLGLLNAGTGTVTVNATFSADGRITDGNAALTNIVATTADLIADDAIGVIDTSGTNFFAGVNASGNDALETTVTTFNSVIASAVNATINILDSGSPVFTAPVDAGTGVAGSTLITVAGNVIATTVVDFADAGDSVGIIATGTVTVPAPLVVSQDLLLSGADIDDTNAGDLDSVTATRALLTSAAAETLTTSTIGTLDATSSGGAVVVAAESDGLTLSDLDGTGTAISAAGNATIVAAGGVTVSGTVSATGAGNIDISIDSDATGIDSLIVQGDLSSATTIDLSGAVDGNDLIDIDLDITAANGALTIDNAATVDLAGGVDLQGAGVAITTAIGGINLSGADGTLVTVTSTGDGNTVNTAAVTSTSNPDLTLTSDGGLTIGATTNIGSGALSATVDADDNNAAGETLLVSGSPTAGTVTLSGGGTGTGDTIDIDANVSATTGALILKDAATVDVAANIALTGVSVVATDDIGVIDLSGAGTNTVTSTNGNVALGPVTDSAAANLTVSSEADASLAAVTFDDGGAGVLVVTTDSGNDTVGSTLNTTGVVSVSSTVTLSGGTDLDDTVDIDADVTAGGVLTLQNGNVDLGADVDLSGASIAADMATNSVGSINLSGAGTNILTSTGGNVNLASVTDTAAANLTVSSTDNVTLAQITLDAGGAGVLAVTADDDDNTGGATLQVAGDIDVSGAAIFAGGADNDDNIDVDADVTSAGTLTMQNGNVDIAGNLALRGAGVSIVTSIGAINLSGGDATLVTITSTGDVNTINTTAVTSTNNPNLTLASEGGLTIGAATNIGTGAFTATVDSDNDTPETLLVTGSPTAGSITLSGGGTGTGDTIDIDAAISATTGALIIRNAALVDLAANINLTGQSVAIDDGIGVIDLSGAGTNTVTSTNGDVVIGPVTDSAAANLTISSEANVTLSTITLDDGGAGNLVVTADDDDDTVAATLQVAGAVNVSGTATIAGGNDNDDTVDIDAGIVAVGALTITNGNVDIAGDLGLQGAGVAITTNIGGINLSGADGTLVTITSTGNANTINTAAITSTNNPNLTMSSEGGLTIGASTNIGTGTLSATVDSNDDGANILLVSGSPTAGAITLSGGGTGTTDTIDIDANVTATTGALTLKDAVAVDVAANIALSGASVVATDDIGTIDLSGAGTNTVTSTAGDVSLNTITDSAAANLSISSTANVTLAAVTLDQGGAGVLSVTADDDDNTVGATLAAGGVINVTGAASLAGGTDNDEFIDVDADVTAGGALTLSGGSVDLAADVDLTGLSVTADAATSISSINLSGAGTNIVTGTGGSVSIADVTDTAAANLTVSAETDATVAAITLDAGGAGVVLVTADDDDDTVGSTLAVNGVVNTTGAVTLAGGADNDDLMDINADVTSGAALVLSNTSGADLAGNVDLTGTSVTATAAVTGLNLSAAGTNIVTGTAGDVAIAAVTDTADANLTVAATGNATLAAITLDNGGAGNLNVTSDTDNTGTSTLLAAGVITVDGTATLAGGTDNDETLDVDANVTAGGALTLQQGNADLAANVNLAGQSVTATSGIGGINLSGAGTNVVMASGGDVAIAAVTDSANANLTVAATGNVSLSAITLDNGGAGTLSVTADTDNTGASTLLAAGAITVDAAATLSGGTDFNESIDIDANVTSGGTLTVQRGNIDLAANISLTGATVAADNTTNNVGSINLSGAGTNVITGATGAVNIAAVTDSADANLTVSASTNATIAAVTLDNGGAGVVSISADDDDNTAGATLQVGGVISATGAVTLAGGTDNDDAIDVNSSVTSGGALVVQNTNGADLAAGVALTGASVTATNAVTAVNLSGPGANLVTGTAGDIALADVTDSANATMIVRATGGVTLATVTLDDGGSGSLSVTADTDNTGLSTLLAAGAITVDGSASFAGGTDNDELLDFDADVVAGGAVGITNGNVDLAANVDITGLGVAADSNIGTINLSGAGTNIFTSTGGDVSVAAVTDSAAANLTVSSTGNVTTSSITLDAGGAGVVLVTADDDDNTAAATLLAGGAINTTGAVTLSGGNDNDELLDINGDVTSGATLTLQNGNADLAADVDLTGTVVAAAAANNLTAINLSGAGTNVITSTAGAVDVTAVTDSAAANLTLSAATNVTMAAVTLDAGGAGNLTATADDDDNTAASTLTANGVVAVTGDVVLMGATDSDEIVDVNASITSGGATSITTAATVNLADVMIDAQGGALTITPGTGIVLDGGTAATLQTTTAGESDVVIAGVTATANESLTINSRGTIDFQGAINLGTGDLAASADTNNNGTLTLAIDQTIAADDVDLAAGGAGSTADINQSAVVTATTLDAIATNGISLTAQNVVPTVTLNNTNAGNVTYNSDLATNGANTLTVSGTNTANAGTVSVTETTDGLTVAAAGIASDAGAIVLTTTAAAQLMTLEGAVQSHQPTASGANITLNADRMDLDGTGGSGSINAGTAGTVRLVSRTAADAIDLGSATDAAANTLGLSSAELTAITAEHLLIGNVATAGITFSADVSALNVADTVHLTSAQNAGTAVNGAAGGLTANNLAVTASGDVNMSSGNNVTNLAVAAAGFDVTFNEADGVVVTEVDDGVNPEAGIRGRNIRVTVTGADGDLTVARGIVSTGLVDLRATRNIVQEGGIATVTTSTTGGSDDISYLANSDNTGMGAIIMQADSAVETAGTSGADITLTAGTAVTATDVTGASDVTLGTVDAGEDGDISVQSFDGSIRDDLRDSSALTGETIVLRAQGDVGGADALTVLGDKSAAIEVNVNALQSLTSRAIDGNNQLMVNQLTAADPQNLDVDILLKSNDSTNVNPALRTGMQAGVEKQVFAGVLDGHLTVTTDIDLSATATPDTLNNDLFLFTGAENRNININGNITLDRVNGDPTRQGELIVQATGDITQLNTTMLTAFKIEAEAPTGSVEIYTGTDELEAEGGEGDNISITNTTPADSQHTEMIGGVTVPTTVLKEEIVTAGAGNITIVNAGALTINKAVKTTGTGDISITANSPLLVTAQISSGGDVTLTSTGDAETDGVYIQQDALLPTNGTIQSNSVTDGSITITAENKVVMDANAVISTLASGAAGAVTITADNNSNVGGTGSGEVAMAAGARVTAAGGAPITVLSNGGSVTVSELNAGVVNAGDVTITAGTSIADANGASVNVIGNDVSLTGPAGIDVDIIAAGTLTADSSGADGAINIESKLGSIGLATATAGAGTVTLDAEDGGISDQNGASVLNITGTVVNLTASGTISSDVAAATSVNARIQSSGAVAEDGSIDLRSAADLPLGRIEAGDGAVRLTAAQSVTDALAGVNITGGTVTLTAQAGGITTEVDASSLVTADASALADQTITLASTAGDLRVGNVTTSGNGTVNLASTAGITQTSGTVVASVLNLAAPGSVGGANSLINTTAGTLNATGTIGGLYVNETDALILGNVTSSDGIQVVAGGDVTGGANLAATGGDASVRGTNVDLGTVSGTAVELNGSGTLAAGAVTAGAGATLEATGDLNVATVAAVADVEMESGANLATGAVSGANVEIDAGGTLGATGAITATGNTSLTSGGNITATGTITSAANVNLDATGNLTAADVDATGNATFESGGNTVLTDVAGADVQARSAGTLNVTTVVATGGIRLDSTGNLVGASLTSAGAATLTSLADATVGTVNSASLSASSVGIMSATTLTTTGDASLNAGGVLSSVTTNAGGDATFTSGSSADIGAVTATDVAATTGAALTAGAVTASGQVNFDVAGALTATTIAATGDARLLADGNVSLTNLSGANLSVASGGTLGTGTVTATGSASLDAEGALSSADITAAGSATAESRADVTVGTVTGTDVRLVSGNNLGSGTVNAGGAVTALAGGDVTSNDITATGNALVNAGDNLTVVGSVTAADITLGAGTNITSSTLIGSGAVNLDAGGTIDSDDLSAGTTASVDGAGDVMVGTVVAGSIALESGATLTSSSLTATGAVGVDAVASINSGAIDAGGNASLQAGTDLTVATVTGADVSLDAGSVLTATTVTASGTATLAADSALNAETISATGDATVAGGAVVTVDNISGASVAVSGSGDVTTGDFASGSSVSVTSATASVTVADGAAATDVVLDAATSISLAGIVAGDNVSLAAPAGLVDLNGSALNVTATSLTVTGMMTVIDTAVGNLNLDVTEAAVSNAGDLVISRADSSGSVNLQTSGTLTLNELNAAGQAVLIRSGGDIVDGNGAGAANVRAGQLDVVTGGAIAGLDLEVSNLRVGAADATLSNSGTLALEGAAVSGNFALANDGLLQVDSIVAGTVSLTATGAITDSNGDTVNVRANSLTLTGEDVDLDTDVDSLTLATADADISNSSVLTVGGVVRGRLMLENRSTLTITDLLTWEDASLSTLGGNIELGSIESREGLLLSAGAYITDVNGSAVNVTSVLDTVLRARGTVGDSSETIDVDVGGTLSVEALNFDAKGVAANFSGRAGAFGLPDEIGFVLLDPTGTHDAIGPYTRVIGGFNLFELLGAVGSDVRLLESEGRYESVFRFEAMASGLYRTDDARNEISYGKSETPLLTVEDILTSPLGSISFDGWINNRVDEALSKLKYGGK